jgi:hypothetical protein
MDRVVTPIADVNGVRVGVLANRNIKSRWLVNSCSTEILGRGPEL